MTLAPVHTVLVSTKYSANIGSAARATANISKYGKLILIAPQTPVNSQAFKMAAGAQSALDSREEYPSWKEFYQKHPLGLRLALSGKKGKVRKSFSLPDAYHQLLTETENQNLPIYLVFGCEDNGLSSDDLDECHMTTYLPARGPFTSLNLAQAVLLAQYIIAEEQEKMVFGKSSYQEGFIHMKSQNFGNLFPDEVFMEWLKKIGFAIDEDKENIYSTLRRMILRSAPSSKEIENLNKALQQSLRLTVHSKEKEL